MSRQEILTAFEESWEASNSEQLFQPSIIERFAPNKSLRINFNSMNLGLGGGNRVILELARRLNRRGHDVSINAIGRDGDAKWFGDLSGIKLNFVFPSKIKRLINQKLLKRSFLDVQTELLTETLSNCDCDVNVATFCLTAAPTFESGKGDMCYLVQNYEPLFFTDPAFKEIAEKSYHLPLMRLCVSKWLQGKVGGVYIGNGVNTEIFHPQNSFEEKEPNSVMYQYRGIPWKGDELAIKTLRYLYQSNKNLKIHIVARKQEHLGADFPFKLYYDLPDAELAKLYSHVRVLLFTSKFEGYGLPPLEALACGTNVVSKDFVGNEYLWHGQNCFLANEAEDLSAAILKLLSDDEVAKAQIKQAVKTVKTHDFDQVVDRVLQNFNSYRRE